MISEDEDTKSLRQFFDEMCFATPERLDLLRDHDMLLTWQLNLDDKVMRHFGKLEG